MKRTLTIIAAAALASCVLAPAAAAENESPSPKQVANAFCHDQKKAMKAETGSNKAFKELYGGKRAMQTCKRQNRGEAEEIVQNAAQQCKQAEESDPSGFQTTYGENENAYGKCVSQAAKEQSNEQAENLANAAHECKRYRRDDPDGFAAEYGTKKNAYGKCVSDRAREDEEEPEPAPTA